MGEVRRPDKDIGREVKEFRHGKRWKPRKNPCDRPPGQPDFTGQPGPMDFEIRFRVREAKTHLEYYGYGYWNEQTVDSNGLPFEGDIDRYEFQWKATTDAAGNNYAMDGTEKVRGRKTVSVADDNKAQTLEVTGSNGGNFKISVGNEETGTIAWNATAAQVKTALVALNAFAPADITEGGGPLGTNPVTLDFAGDDKTPKLVISDDDLTGSNPSVTLQAKDKYRVYFGEMARPRRWYVSGRLRVRAGKGCWSDWSLWTTPTLPVDATSEPAPPAPANTTIDFDHLHSSRFDPLRCIITGDYVGNWDVPGGDHEDDVARYHVQLQWSNDGGTTWHWPPKHHMKRDRDDNDGKWRIVFHNIDRRKLYRYRVCSEDRYNRRGAWAPGAGNANQRLDGWSAGADPKTFDENPPDPTFVTFDVDRARLQAEIAEPTVVGSIDWKVRVDYWEWEVYYDTVTAPNLVRKDRMHRGLVKHFSLNKPKGHTVICRVRAVSASDEKSGWTQTSAAPGTPPLPTIGSATFDALGPRHNRYRAIIPVSVNDTGHTDNVNTIVVQMSHKTTNATPTVSDKKTKDRVRVGDDPQEALFRGIPKGHYIFVRAKSLDGDDKESAWTSWTAMGRPRDSGVTATPTTPTGVVVTAPAPRRIVGKWDDPDDDDATRWKVVVKQGVTTKETVFVRNNKHVYRAPVGDKGLVHSMEVQAINETGALSTMVSDSTTEAGAEGGVHAVGEITTVGHQTAIDSPPGTLPLDGVNYAATYPTATYPALFAKWGYSYGGSGANFGVPDYRRRHPKGVGAGQTVGQDEGVAEVDRSDGHGTHGDHRHRHGHNNHKHGHGHGHNHGGGGHAHGHNHGSHEHGHLHGNHGHGHDHGNRDGTHSHGGSPLSAGNPTTTQINISAGGSQRLATDTHSHNIQGQVGDGASTHTHNSDASPGDGAFDTTGRFPTDDNSPSAVTSDSTNDASIETVNDPNFQGPTDSFGATVTIDEPGAPSGHKQHGMKRVHFVVWY